MQHKYENGQILLVSDLEHLIDYRLDFNFRMEAGEPIQPDAQENFQIAENDSLDNVLTTIRDSLNHTILLDRAGDKRKDITIELRINELGDPGIGFDLQTLFEAPLTNIYDMETYTRGLISSLNTRAEQTQQLYAIQKREKHINLETWAEIVKHNYKILTYGMLTYAWENIDSNRISPENQIFVENMQLIRQNLHDHIRETLARGDSNLLTSLFLSIGQSECARVGRDIAILMNLSFETLSALVADLKTNLKSRGVGTSMANIYRNLNTFSQFASITIATIRKMDFMDTGITDNLGYKFKYDSEMNDLVFRENTKEFLKREAALYDFISEYGFITIETEGHPLFEALGIQIIEFLPRSGEVGFNIHFANTFKLSSSFSKETLMTEDWVNQFSRDEYLSEEAVRFLTSTIFSTLFDLAENRMDIKKGTIPIRKFRRNGEIRLINNTGREVIDNVNPYTAEVYHDPQFILIGDRTYELDETVIHGLSESYINDLFARMVYGIMKDRTKNYKGPVPLKYADTGSLLRMAKHNN